MDNEGVFEIIFSIIVGVILIFVLIIHHTFWTKRKTTLHIPILGEMEKGFLLNLMTELI